MANIPRSVFSDADIEVIMWLLKMNGVPDVPTSTYKLKKIGTMVKESCNIEVRRFLGAFGHTYYVVSPKSLVAMVCMLLYSLRVYHNWLSSRH